MSRQKSITAKIHAIILQSRRKYYFSVWPVLSPIFLFAHHQRDIEASTGTSAFHCPPLPDERGFPIWYAVKVIWIAVMFLYNMPCQAKTGKHFFPPKNSFQLCFSLQPLQIYCTYLSARPFLLGNRARPWFCKSEIKNFSAVPRNLKDILVLLYRGALTEKNVDNLKPARTFRLLLFHNRIHRIYWGRSETAQKTSQRQMFCHIIWIYILQYIYAVWHIYILFGEIIWGYILGKRFCLWQWGLFVNSV